MKGLPSDQRPIPPALPAWKAFVVQFSYDAGTKDGGFSGRVEHLSTGRRARFESADALLALLQTLLDDLGKVRE